VNWSDVEVAEVTPAGDRRNIDGTQRTAGEVAVQMVVAVQLTDVAGVAPNFSVVDPGTKPEPYTVTGGATSVEPLVALNAVTANAVFG